MLLEASYVRDTSYLTDLAGFVTLWVSDENGFIWKPMETDEMSLSYGCSSIDPSKSEIC